MTCEVLFSTVSALLKENSYWLIPLVTTTVFAGFNLKTARENLKIAENQRRLQNSAFCYQLFEKRMEIYTDMNRVLADITAEGSGQKDYAGSFLRCTRDIPFLFGNEIVKLRDDIYGLICQLHRDSVVVDSTLEGRIVSEKHEENCATEEKLLKQISEIQVDLKEYFKPYICFGDFKIESMNGVKK